MKLEKAEVKNDYLWITLAQGLSTVQKFVRKDSRVVGILRKIREAKRDFACDEFGKDWRSHIEGNGFFASGPNEEEAAILDEIADRLS